MISDLPTEVMMSIFKLVVQSTGPQTSISTTIWLSGISKPWRSIIFNQPELWDDIDCSHPSLLDLCIQHAGARTLSFRHILSQKGDPEYISTISRLFYRVKSLELSHKYESFSRRRLIDWTTPAPCLQTLNLSRFGLPKNLFDGHAPLLQCLVLNSCSFFWPSLPRLPQLQHLSIHDPASSGNAKIFLKVLALTPNLQSIDLSGAFNASQDAEGIVALPKLQRLSISRSFCHHVIILLRHLSFPHTAQVNLDLKQVDLQDHERIFEELNRSRVGSTLEAQTIRVIARRWLNLDWIETGHNPGSVCLRFIPPGSTMTLIIPLLSQFITLKLVSLDVHGSRSLPPFFWTSYCDLPMLRDLKIRNAFAWSFLEFVQTKGHTFNHCDGTTTSPFPHLQDLFFQDGSSELEEFESYLLQLADYLQGRSRRGLMVTNLTVVGLDRMSKETEEKFVGRVQSLKHMVKGEGYDVGVHVD